MAHVDAQLDKVASCANKLEAGIRSSEVADRLAPVEGAKLDVAVAYSIASLFYVMQNIQGQTGDKFPIQSELARIKEHVKQINAHAAATTAAAGGAATTASSSAAGASAAAPAAQLNKEASKRVISHHLSSSDKPSSADQSQQQQKKKKKRN
jgi:hypothetical protein